MLWVWWSLFAACLAASGDLTHAPRSTESNVPELPECASSCLSTAVKNSPCSATNQTCLCTDEALQTEAGLCISTSCSVKDALFTKNVTMTNCGAPVRDRGPQYVALSNSLAILANFFVLLRFGIKIYMRIGLSLDDWFALITMIVGVPNAIIPIRYIVPNGLGRDIWTLTPDNITNFARYFFITSPIYFAQVALVKLSILFFYLKIFISTTTRRILLGTIVFNCLFGIAFVIVSVVQCRPISYFWTQWDGEHSGECVNLSAIAWANSGISIALDVWMLAIPLWQLKRLTLSWRKKLGGGLMFSVGTFITIVSILRLRSLVMLTSEYPNPTWNYFEVSQWSVIEICVGMICACMPTMRLLFVRISPKIFGTTAQQHSYPSFGSKRTHSKIRATGTSDTLSVDRSHQPKDRNDNTYAAKYGDDEVQLVHMKTPGREVDCQSSRSELSL
ncbi:hypothetical protein BGZ63DRAFT_495829 [Mariannaea sp. PMI_226]|nr:hypothetical protein BGZ63DRAFT_495829 [Mariannaea sp. PMI_226]